MAEGKYICFLDVDDEYAPGFFTAAVERLEAEPSLVAVGCGVDLVNLHRPVESWHADTVADSIPGNLLVRTEVVRRLGGFPCHPAFRGQAAGEDLLFRQELFRLGKWAVITQSLYKYRVQPGSHFDVFVDRAEMRDGQLNWKWLTDEERDGSWVRAALEYQKSIRLREAARTRLELEAAATSVEEYERLLNCPAVSRCGSVASPGFVLHWLARRWPAEGRVVLIGSSEMAADCLIDTCRTAQKGKLAVISPSPDVERRLQQLDPNAWVELHKQPWLDASLSWTEPVRLLVVGRDLPPESEEPLFAAWSKHLAPHGLAIFHDIDGPSDLPLTERLHGAATGWLRWPRTAGLEIVEKTIGVD